jgi:hypothetical protein
MEKQAKKLRSTKRGGCTSCCPSSKSEISKEAIGRGPPSSSVSPLFLFFLDARRDGRSKEESESKTLKRAAPRYIIRDNRKMASLVCFLLFFFFVLEYIRRKKQKKTRNNTSLRDLLVVDRRDPLRVDEVAILVLNVHVAAVAEHFAVHVFNSLPAAAVSLHALDQCIHLGIGPELAAALLGRRRELAGRVEKAVIIINRFDIVVVGWLCIFGAVSLLASLARRACGLPLLPWPFGGLPMTVSFAGRLRLSRFPRRSTGRSPRRSLGRFLLAHDSVHSGLAFSRRRI